MRECINNFVTERWQLRSLIELSTSDYDKEKLQERLAKLSGGVAVLKVGLYVIYTLLAGSVLKRDLSWSTVDQLVTNVLFILFRVLSWTYLKSFPFYLHFSNGNHALMGKRNERIQKDQQQEKP